MAGILETFGILFESDSDDVKKGAEEAESSLDDLEAKLGEVDEQTTELGESFADLVGNAKAAIASLLSVGLVSAAIINTAKQTDEIGKFSDVLGLNVQDVHAWSEAVIRAGGDAGAFQSSVASLTDSMTDLIINGSGPAVDVLARLGISAINASGKFKTAFELLPDLAEAFQRLSDAESVGFGQKLGLDRGTILLLQQGRQAVDSLISRQKELGVVTNRDYQAAAAFNDQWADTKQIFNAILTSAATTILPALTAVLKALEHVTMFLSDNKDFFVGFFIAVGAAITKFFLPSIIAAGAAIFTALSPVLLTVAAVLALAAAFALLYDDIANFIKGNDSLLGKLIEKYPLLGKVVDAIGAAIKAYISTFKDFGKFAATLFTDPAEAMAMLSRGLDSVKNAIAGTINELINSLPDLGEFVDDLVNYIKEKTEGLGFLGEALSGIFTLPLESIRALKSVISELFSFIQSKVPDLTDAIDKVKSFFGIDDQPKEDSVVIEHSKKTFIEGSEETTTPIQDNITKMNKTLNVIDNNPLNGQSVTSIQNANRELSSKNSVSIDNITVNTKATDAKGIAREIGSALKAEMQATVSNFDDGVKA